jgi:glutamine synthetase
LPEEEMPEDVSKSVTTAADVDHFLTQNQIETVKLGGVDIDGLWRGKRMPSKYFAETVAASGTRASNIVFGWDIQDDFIPDLSYTGWQTGYRDLVLKPDLSTLAVVPWERSTASVMCDFEEPDGTPVTVSPRYIMRRALDMADGLGLTVKIGYELEFSLFAETTESLHEKGFSSPRPILPGSHTYSLFRSSLTDHILGDIRKHMLDYGIEIEGSFHEWGPGQIEINLHYEDARVAADHAVLYRNAVKEICAQHGVMASFMARPTWEAPGNSGHVHQSVWGLDAQNAFFDRASGTLSQTCRHYIGGLVELMPALTLMCCPFPNSYKRRTEDSFSGTTSSWGYDNRTTALRVILGNEKSTRIESRLPGSDANPLLVVAACIAGGMYGVREKIDAPQAVEGSAYARDDLPRLPATLLEAIDAFETNEVVREIFGRDFVEHYVATRRWEQACSERMVSDWERSRYLEML